jgi:hypothetical protein
MGTATQQALSAAMITLLRPLVRLLLRNGVPHGAFAELSKRVYVEVAEEDFSIPGRKPSKSRVAILTGLSRKEVLRVKRLPPPSDSGAVQRYNRAARVISGWVRDRRFRSASGRPASLRLDGEAGSFQDLVRSYSGDAPARAVLDELLRVGAAERGSDGRIRLVERSYVPRAGVAEKLGILGTDVSDLISTIDHNIFSSDAPFFQRKVCYDNLPAEVLPGLKRNAHRKAQALLEHFDRWLSERDRDLHPEVAGTGRKRAGIGIYYFEGEHPGGNGR